MNTWPLWVWIGLLILSQIARIAQIGKTVETTYTAAGAIVSLGVTSLLIWYLVTLMQHLC